MPNCLKDHTIIHIQEPQQLLHAPLEPTLVTILPLLLAPALETLLPWGRLTYWHIDVIIIAIIIYLNNDIATAFGSCFSKAGTTRYHHCDGHCIVIVIVIVIIRKFASVSQSQYLTDCLFLGKLPVYHNDNIWLIVCFKESCQCITITIFDWLSVFRKVASVSQSEYLIDCLFQGKLPVYHSHNIWLIVCF